MPKKLRHVPEGGSLVEVTCRTLQSRLLLTPRAHVKETVIGILARAKRMYPVQLIAFAFVSNHFHLLIQVEDAGRMAELMRYVNSNLAKEVGRLADWKEKLWSRRYQHIVVSDEEAAGVWYDRTQEYRYRLRGKEPEPKQFATVETLTLDPLPCWKHLPPEEYRARVEEIVAEIVAEARAAREAKGVEPLGADAIRRQQPHTRPNRTKKSPAPLFHTESRKAYLDLREAYSRFVAAFETRPRS